MTKDTRRIFVDPTTGEERPPRGYGERYMEVWTEGEFEYVQMTNVISHTVHEEMFVVNPATSF